MKSILLIILLTAFSMIQTQQSLFETIGIAGNTTSKEEDQPQPMVHHNKDTITSLIEKLKEEIKTPFLKDNITAENIAKYIATLLSGNQFLNNLEVKDITELSKVEVRENIKVNGKATINSLIANKVDFPSIHIDDNEVTFDSSTKLKLKDVEYKIGDVFEAITFTKYIVSICGEQLDKCDFNILKKNNLKSETPKITKVNDNTYLPQFKEMTPSSDIRSIIDKEYEEYLKKMNEINSNINNPTQPNTENNYNSLLDSYYYSSGFLNSNRPISSH